ncbi:hypothetical protein EI94DRAFT_1745277, partial [Lactarius quietus]
MLLVLYIQESATSSVSNYRCQSCRSTSIAIATVSLLPSCAVTVVAVVIFALCLSCSSPHGSFCPACHLCGCAVVFGCVRFCCIAHCGHGGSVGVRCVAVSDGVVCGGLAVCDRRCVAACIGKRRHG